jgi:hypothetical protein
MADSRPPHNSRRAASALRSAINQRAHHHVREVTEQRYWAEIGAWARNDSAGFPSRIELHQQVTEELEVLCRGLGPWASVSPGAVFPPEPAGSHYPSDWFGEPDDCW